MSFTQTLSWRKRINYAIGKASRKVNFNTSRNFKMCPQKALHLTNVRPILEYACVLWDFCHLYLRNELDTAGCRWYWPISGGVWHRAFHFWLGQKDEIRRKPAHARIVCKSIEYRSALMGCRGQHEFEVRWSTTFLGLVWTAFNGMRITSWTHGRRAQGCLHTYRRSRARDKIEQYIVRQ